jgi:hypothetical protein
VRAAKEGAGDARPRGGDDALHRRGVRRDSERDGQREAHQGHGDARLQVAHQLTQRRLAADARNLGVNGVQDGQHLQWRKQNVKDNDVVS